ncbi:MAG: hypothetical protein PWQ39_189 [Thermacetogenium sp.]|nr:hypothetical protein [Thermacetogenium sp.]
MAFNMTATELLSLAAGCVTGTMVAGLSAAIFSVPFLFCVPVAFPFVGAAAYLTFKRVKKAGAVMPCGVYLYKKILYGRTPKHYVNFRK